MKSALSNLVIECLGGSKLQMVDVGARDGIADRWLRYGEILSVFAFEPDPEECARLNALAPSLPYPIRFLPQALGSVDGKTAVLNICRNPGCSSTYPPNMALCGDFSYGLKMEVVKTNSLMLSRMDTVLGTESIQPDAIKIDTQGSELDILVGAGELLKRVAIVELEVEFVPQYIDQPLFADVDAFMRSCGFDLRGLRRTFWRRKTSRDWQYSARGGQLVHGDALYVNSRFLAEAAADLPSTMKILIALSAYGQDDLLVSMLSQPQAGIRQLPEKTRRAIAQELSSSEVSWYAPLLRPLLRAYSHRQLRSRTDSLRSPDATDWHDPGFY